MSDQRSDNPATNAQALSLPRPVLVALSILGIDPARFCAVIDAFGPLSNDGQVGLVNQLIEARDGYLSHRIWKCDTGTQPGLRRKRLKEIASPPVSCCGCSIATGNLGIRIRRPRLRSLSSAASLRSTGQIRSGILLRD